MVKTFRDEEFGLPMHRAYDTHELPNSSQWVMNQWNAILRFIRRHELQQEVLFLLLPTLYFRFFPFIMTHNSTPLSIWLALTLVYIPVRVVWSVKSRLFSEAAYVNQWRDKTDYVFVVPRRVKSTLTVHQFYTTPKPSTLHKGNSRSQWLLWLASALFSFWVYSRGLASPFPDAAAYISQSPTLLEHQARNATYYIAACFWNNEEILDSWTAQTLKLISYLGEANVYVSIAENDSEDESANKLLQFGKELSRRHIMHSINITSGLRGQPSDNPWRSPQHRMEYMANLRNGVLMPLKRLHRRFDNIIFMNDVVYHHTDVLKLIAAVGGDDVAAEQRGLTPVASHSANLHHPKPQRRRMACSIDMDGATLYDAWVLRDKCGRSTSGLSPFFQSEEDRRAVRQGRVFEVGTCWNGIVVLDGDMFIESQLRSPTSGWGDDTDMLRFRQPPGCIISECMQMPLAITNITGGAPVVMDPTVVIGYYIKWWKYYAVWMRTPLVRLWMRLFEDWYWELWWKMGMGKALRWTGLLDGKEEGECVVHGWPKCGSDSYTPKGALKIKPRHDGL